MNTHLKSRFTPQEFFNVLLNFTQSEIFTPIQQSNKFSDSQKETWFSQLKELKGRILELKELKKPNLDKPLVPKKVTLKISDSLKKMSLEKKCQKRKFIKKNFPKKNEDERKIFHRMVKSNKKQGEFEEILTVSKFKIYKKQETSDIKSIQELNEMDSSDSNEFEKPKKYFKQIGKSKMTPSLTEIKEMVENLLFSTKSDQFRDKKKLKKMVRKLISNISKIAEFLNESQIEDISKENSRIGKRHFGKIVKNWNERFIIPAYKPFGYRTIYGEKIVEEDDELRKSRVTFFGRKMKHLGKPTQLRKKLTEEKHAGMLSSAVIVGLLKIIKNLNFENFQKNLKEDGNENFVLRKIFRRVMLSLYKICPDYYLYLEHLMIYKSFIQIQAKIVEFLAGQVIEDPEDFNAGNFTLKEFRIMKWALVESRAICGFFSEFVLKFIQNIVRKYFSYVELFRS